MKDCFCVYRIDTPQLYPWLVKLTNLGKVADQVFFFIKFVFRMTHNLIRLKLDLEFKGNTINKIFLYGIPAKKFNIDSVV